MGDNKTAQYWIGPADIRIPVELILVPSLEDGICVCQDGRIIDAAYATFSGESLTIDQYRQNWAKCIDGIWYWRYKMKNGVLINEEENHWIGPANIRIPMEINEVPGLTSGMVVYQDGNVRSSIFCVEPQTKDEYREDHATCVDNIWYWVK